MVNSALVAMAAIVNIPNAGFDITGETRTKSGAIKGAYS
jgi:hypothetical protein